MLTGLALCISNFAMDAMQSQLKDSAWQQYLSYRDYVWWASGIMGFGGLGMLLVSFKFDVED